MTSMINDLDIAVIGMSGRFPGARNVAEFWRNLKAGVDSCRPLSEEELARAGVAEAASADPSYVRAASRLDGIELFDASFFGYSPREASVLDPQARVFLECAWEALETAGYNPQRTEASVGVYAAQSMSTYLLGHVHDQLALGEFALAGGNIQAIIGNGSDFLPTRVSYKLNLSGPSVNVQSACSSSLVAVHLARQALLAGECDMALAGGVSIYLPQDAGYTYQEGMILSPDGHCRPFDASAQGTIFGRGAGVVVLKLLSDAVRDGDEVYAVIKGSAVNNDGAGKVGYTAPGVEGQARVIAEALANADVDAASISHVEAHGTGTAQGDPIEIEALTRAFRATSARSQYCAISSVKGNIGHLDVAAGIAGLIKTVLMLRHRELVASLHYASSNPQIDFERSPFFVNDRARAWDPVAAGPRRAGVSSFGMGGTNAHVVLEEAPPTQPRASLPDRPVHLLTLSARTPTALSQLAASTAEWLREQADDVIPAACFTTNTGRSHFAHRAAVVVRDRAQAAEALGAVERRAMVPDVSVGQGSGTRPRTVFLFTGQGSQYTGMGAGLYRSEPVFREAIDRCASVLAPEMDLRAVLHEEASASLLSQTRYTQPALFALEYALVQVWQEWGIVPDVVLGHSLGEEIAACIAGVYSLEDGLRLVSTRARMMQALPQDGAMAAVFAARDLVAEAIAPFADRVSIAALNAPDKTVVSGERAAVESIAAALAGRGIECRPLLVSHAFHSPLMDPMLTAFEAAAREIRFMPARIPLISNVTAAPADDALLRDPAYWRRHIREPVRFAESIAALDLAGSDVVIEIGPSPTLLTLGRECVSGTQPNWLPSLRRGRTDLDQILETLGAAYTAGIEPSWDGYHRDRPRRRIALPTYPFQRERHWIEPITARRGAAAPHRSGNGLLGRRISSPVLSDPVFETVVGARTVPYVVDHTVAGVVVFPATGFIELALAAAPPVGLADAVVENLSIDQALACPDAERVVHTVLSTGDDGRTSFRIYSRSDDGVGPDAWVQHASGDLVNSVAAADEPGFTGDATRAQCPSHLAGGEYYEQLQRRDFSYGPAFRGIAEIWWRHGEAVASIDLSVPADELRGYRAHPAVLDAALQAVLAAAGQLESSDDRLYVPTSFERIVVRGSLANIAWTHARMRSGPDATPVADIVVADASGRVIATVDGVRLTRIRRDALRRLAGGAAPDPVYRVDWQEKSLPPVRVAGAVADFVPSIDTIERALEPVVALAGERYGLSVYDRVLPALDRICAGYVAASLRELGWSPSPGETCSTAALMSRLGIESRYERMLERCLEMLVEDGVLCAVETGWRVEQDLAAASASASAMQELLASYPACVAELTLTQRCGEHLADVLSGRVDPLQLLFPGGSTEDLERLYRDAPFTRAYNMVVSEAVSAALAKVPADRKVRILEIGAGTGGTSTYVLPTLPVGRVDYTFTDASQLFMARAKRRFAEHSFVEYRVLDIEQDPRAQGYRSGDFDLVLATNVLHAAPDVHQTLRYVKDVLAPGGLLAMVEGISRQRWVDLIFGLTDGWWKATDTELRGSYPLISRSQWSDVLADVGFEGIASVPAEDRPPICEQAVMLARNPLGASAAGNDPPADAGDYVVVGERTGIAGAVIAELASAGRVRIIEPGDGLSVDADGSVSADFMAPEQMRAAIDVLLPPDATCSAIVHCVGLDDATAVSSDADLERRLTRHCGSLLHLVQAVASRTGIPPKLAIVTRGVHTLSDADAPADPVPATAWGFARVIALEHPELSCARIDLDPQSEAKAAAAQVVAELLHGEGDDEVVWRNGERRVSRLVDAAELTAGAARESGVHLEIAERGVLDRIKVQPANRRSPGRSEVEIAVSAAGLNFKDVLNALGTYPGDPGPLGLECAGRITAVGADVRGLVPGDEVLAIAPGCFGTYAIAHADLVVRRPDVLSAADAAAVPAAFLTAYHALHDLAHVKAGDRVLIHAAAGGVGMAAVRIALHAGAEVFGTAGTAAKRELLTHLGVTHAFDSRSISFADEILRITAGKGVDVVVNSLAGDFIERSFAVLAPGGRFVELGKAGIWDDTTVAALGRGHAYHVVDVQALAAAEPVRMGQALRAVVEMVATGQLDPLPVRTFPLAAAADAFRFMAQAKHVGKIVLELPPVTAALPLVRTDATYLITGGFGALGLLMARWLVERGAGGIALMGRREPGADARALAAELEAAGANVALLTGDVSDPTDVARVLSHIAESMPALRGVIHAAGTLDDGALSQQRWDRFERVMAAKVYGAWNLDRQTAELPLDWFVLFSTLAAVLGSRGQANHAAANAYMDALAVSRRARGLPALSINWGAWSEIGAAAEGAVLARLQRMGIGAIAPSDGLRLFEQLLERSVGQGDFAKASAAVLPVDWPTYVAESLGGRVPPFLAGLMSRRSMVRAVSAPSVASPATKEAGTLLERLTAARPAGRRELVTSYLRERVVRSLGLDTRGSLDLRQPLSELGLDSLMAVELRTRIAEGAGVSGSLPATLLFDYPTIETLTDYLLRRLMPEAAQTAVAATGNGVHAATRAAVAELSEEEAEAQLLAELSEMQ